jgi:hypothetical protein
MPFAYHRLHWYVCRTIYARNGIRARSALFPWLERYTRREAWWLERAGVPEDVDCGERGGVAKPLINHAATCLILPSLKLRLLFLFFSSEPQH